MDCKDCNKNNKAVDHVPYISHEADMARQERTIRRLWILVLVSIFLFVGSNLAWIIYENQFEDVAITHEVTQDTDDGGNNTYNGTIAGGDYYGETESQNNG